LTADTSCVRALPAVFARAVRFGAALLLAAVFPAGFLFLAMRLTVAW
jgi:hypothetical protein